VPVQILDNTAPPVKYPWKSLSFKKTISTRSDRRMSRPQHLFLKGVPEMKKPEFLKNRGMKDDETFAALARLTTECNDKAVKETLLKIKVLNSFDVNCSGLKQSDRNTLEATIEYLAANNVTFDSSNLNKEGLVFAILSEISKRLPYRCESCSEVVTNDHKTILVAKCKVCKIGACKSCHDGSQIIYICPPCEVIVTEIKAMPISMLKAKAKPKITQVPKDPVLQDVIDDETDEEYEEELPPTPPASTPLPGSRGQCPGPGRGAASVRDIPDGPTPAESNPGSPRALGGGKPPSQPPGGPGRTPIVETDPEAGFSIQNRRERKKAARNASQTTPSPTQNPKCFFHTHGGCRHGLMGKTPVLGVKECSRIHDPICKKFLNNGSGLGGCKSGDSCQNVHPRMCRESIRSRQCTKQKDEKRCPLGYHVRGTKLVEVITTEKRNSTNPKAVPTKVSNVPVAQTQDPSPGPASTSPNLESLTSFLEVMIRTTLERLLRPPPAAPPSPPAPQLDLLAQLRGALAL
jgi:hypothetical protein